jgi:hypothetical protein
MERPTLGEGRALRPFQDAFDFDFAFLVRVRDCAESRDIRAR